MSLAVTSWRKRSISPWVLRRKGAGLSQSRIREVSQGRNQWLDFFVIQFFTPIRVFGGLDEFNRSTLGDVGPLGGDNGMAVLKDMNDLELGHNAFVKSLASRVDVLK